MRYATVLSFLFTTINPGDMGPLVFLAKCDVIIRFRRISFNMSQGFRPMPRLLGLDLGKGMHTCTAKMSALGGHYSVFALLEFYWNVRFPFFNCF